MNKSPATDNPRVTVTLKALVDLAKPAGMLSLGHANIRAAQSGNYLSHLKGRGMAFDETRLYQPGDDVRRIDWRVTARTDKPHSKIFKEERERPMFIAVDYRATMAFATRGVFKSVQAARLAGLLAWAALKQGDRIGGQIFSDDGCQEVKPQTGKPALLRFLNALVNPNYNGAAVVNLAQPLFRLLHHARPGSRVYILSDFRGMNSAAENHLANLARHCEVVLVHIADPLESSLPSQGRYRFTDGWREVLFDSGDKQRLQAYRQRFQDRRAYLQKLANKLRLTLIPCTTQQAPLDALNGTRARPAA
ncbi:DUF58 domain-containing protein [Methylomonas fluvii]|uniref:DUF58 domain-containing protein n=1 Tax=Methylomonas fluvii TaxID=1854564 RepID=A0ABR9D9T9_9GAMM|nr:DUF58 domain-containing protein [Methylomonas fluvii]MBD9359586.1 DUF58 domain-containing protein [Methylomonas fluvii]CAD6872325.1 hypothetical protein PA3071 [Methylomonas fluvii]